MIRSPSRELVAVGLASAALLALEVAEVRVFSYALDPLLVFGAISVALLGMGAAGIALTVRPAPEERAEEWMAWALAAMGASTIAAHALFARVSDAIGFGSRAGVLASALPILAVLLLPYFFGGAVLTLAMSRPSSAIGRLYFANMAASALGCVLVHPLLPTLGAEGVIAGAALLAAWGAVFVSRTPAVVGVALLCTLAAPFSTWLYPFRPDPGDLYGVARAALKKQYPDRDPSTFTPSLEYARWDPVARVEVWSFPGEFGTMAVADERASMRLFAQDGGAGSMLVDLANRPKIARALLDDSVYGGAYLLRTAPKKALVVGLGGGPDILSALHHHVESITGVEINATAIDVVGRAYAGFLGHPYQAPGVRIVHRDGRGWVERSSERFSLVQITGADTYAAGSAGAFMFSESYLYTQEGFTSFIRALDDDGVLSVIRFGLEPLRVVTTELAALRAMGVSRPEEHLVVLRQGIWVNVLLAKRPVSRDESLALVKSVLAANQRPRLAIPVYDALGFGLSAPLEVAWAPGVTGKAPFSELLSLASKGQEHEWIAGAQLDFSPVSDDRPFFFQFLGARHLHRVLAAAPDDWYARGLSAHLAFVVAIVVLAAGLVLFPLRRLRASGPLARPLIYFLALGLGYLVVEMTWMQRTGLFLGHPTHAVVTTLGTLLLSSGLGAAWSSRRDERVVARRSALAVVMLLVLVELAAPPALRLMLPWPFGARVVALAVLTFPLGFAMGMPFPSGLRAVSPLGASMVAFGLAVNSFASIVASLLAIPIALFSGFRATAVLAMALYAVAALAAPRASAAATR
jgi:hypothetical protein